MNTNILFPFTTNTSHTKLHKITEYTKFGYIKDGKEVIDTGLGNCGSFMLGFDRTDILNSVLKKCQKIPFTSGEFFTTTDDILELSDKLASLSGGYKSFYSLSGSDAIEGAVKVARLYHKVRGNQSKNIVLGITESYHGSTYLSSSVAAGSFMSAILGKSNLCKQINRGQDGLELLNNIQKEIDAHGSDNISCICIESCSWLAGLISYNEEFWKELEYKTKTNDILLIIDDIAMCGGKLGKFFGFTCQPDIFTLGKSFSGGYFPLSATLMSPNIYETIKNEFWSHGFTYSFSVSGVYSTLAYIKVIEQEKIFENYNYLLTRSNHLFSKLITTGVIKNYSNNGLYFNLVFHPLSSYENIEDHFFNHGLNVGIDNYKWKGLRVIIPLTANDEYFYNLESKLFSSLSQLSSHLK
jgi:adenosylmethionine-8-amino-7-oxononanoate aminotransferase